MGNSIYPINKGINRSIEFKGLKAQYIWWLAGGIVGILVVFAILYISGLNPFICVLLAIGLLGAVVVAVMRMSKTYGEYGLMKKRAQGYIPKAIRARSRGMFMKNGLYSSDK